jgi:hypothetical protein
VRHRRVVGCSIGGLLLSAATVGLVFGWAIVAALALSAGAYASAIDRDSPVVKLIGWKGEGEPMA